MQVYLVSALVFSLLVAVFAIQNTEMVLVKFFAWSFSVSLVLVILGSAVVGALSLLFLGLFKQVGSWMTIRQLSAGKAELERQLKRLEETINSLKAERAVTQEEKEPQAEEKNN